jgi:NAD-dependent deacetylase
LIEKVKPNPGHLALAALENWVPKLTLITQNVDNLHQKAGSHRVIELHGNIMRSKCSVEMILVESPKDHDEAIPCCPHCGAYLRPDIIWFGETLPQKAWMEAEEAARTADVFLSIGTSSVVYPAASLPWIALSQGGAVVEINPEETPLSDHVTFALAGKAGEVLPAIVEQLNSPV